MAQSVIGFDRTPAPRKGVRTWRRIKRNRQLYAMLALPMLWLVVFQYIPMIHAQISFRDYNVVRGMSASPWVGLDQFERFVRSYNFWSILRNTLVLNVYQLVVGIPVPILLAIGLHHVGYRRFRRTVQMASYAPHFFSTVVMAGLVLQVLSPNGLINQLLSVIGVDAVPFMSEPGYWRSIYVWSGVWQHAGFNCIIFLAALATIDPTLHDAAAIDGASKLQRIRDIDLPGIVPVVGIVLILDMGYLLSTGFEKVLLLQNPLNLPVSEVIDTYVYRIGLTSPVPNFSYAAAIGLFKAVTGLALIVTTNQIVKRFKGPTLW